MRNKGTTDIMTNPQDGTDFLVRDARASDETKIIEMLTAIQRLERGLLGEPMRPSEQSTGEYRAEMRRTIDDHGGVELVYELDGKVLGFISGFPAKDDDVHVEEEFRLHALISDIYVQPNMRNLGVARALIEAFSARMSAEGMHYLRIWSKAKNAAAAAAWLRTGFEPYETVFVKKIAASSD